MCTRIMSVPTNGVASMSVKNYARWIMALCLAVSALVTPAKAQPTITTLAAWGGTIGSFQRIGNTGYCGIGQRFVVLDMTNEAAITELGSITLKSPLTLVSVRGHYAYVSCSGSDPSLVIDVANSAAPIVVWRESASNSN